MKIARQKTEKWHNYEEGDVGEILETYFHGILKNKAQLQLIMEMIGI